MEFSPKEIRRKIEAFLAPENVRNGVPTYIPKKRTRVQEDGAPEDEPESTATPHAELRSERGVFSIDGIAQLGTTAVTGLGHARRTLDGMPGRPMSGRLTLIMHVEAERQRRAETEQQ